MNNIVISNALEVMKFKYPEEHSSIINKIEEIKNLSYINEVSRESDLFDIFENDGIFMKCLLVVVIAKFR
jgi:hypothetical protein